jgi:hypothetical protein
MSKSENKSAKPQKTAENQGSKDANVVHVPFDLKVAIAFARAVEKEGGTFKASKESELSLQFPDGRVVIFDGSSEIPAFSSARLLSQINDDPSKLIEAFKKLVEGADDNESDGEIVSSGHFNTGIDPEITPSEGTDQEVIVGADLEHLPGQIGEKYAFELNLDLLFKYYNDPTVAAIVGESIFHLPGLPDEDILRGKDPRNELGLLDDNAGLVPLKPSFALDDVFEASEDTPLTGNLLGNDILPNGFEDVQIATPPASGTLVINQDGTFTYTPADNFSGPVTFQYSFVDPASGELHIATATINIAAVADPALVNSTSSSGDEDAAANFGSAISYSLTDDDGSEVVSAVTIGNIPTGSAVTYIAAPGATVTGNNVDGYTVTGTPQAIRATLDSFGLTPPENSDEEIALSVSVTTTDENGSTVTSVGTHTINVAAIADEPGGSGSGQGGEDSDISVPISVGLNDTDGSETIDFVEITAPAGVVLGGFGPSGATVVQTGQTWTISGTDAQIEAALAALTATPPLHSADDFELVVTVQSVESNPSGGQVTTPTAQTTFNVPVVVDAVADAPAVDPTSSVADEDTSANFGAAITYGLVDGDGSEVVSQVELGNIPAGSTVVFVASGAAVVTPDGSGGFVITGPQADIRATLDSFAIKPPADSDEDIQISVAVTSTDSNGTTAVGTNTHTVNVAAIADAPSGSGGATGTEDTDIAVPVVVSLNDTDGSETIDFVEITAPPGVTLGGFGPSGATVNQVGQTWTVTGTDAQIQAALAAMTARPPLNSDVDFDLNVTVQSIESNLSGGQVTTPTSQTSFVVPVVVLPSPDAPNVTTGATPVDEDIMTVFGTDITYSLVDPDGSEVISLVEIGGIPTGATVNFVASGGAVVTPDIVGGVTVGYAISGTPAEIRATLDSFAIQPPLHSDTDINLNIAVTTTDTDGSSATTNAVHTIAVEAQADAPNVVPGTTQVDEDTPTVFGTDINYSLVDVDGSEVVSQIVIGAQPGGTIPAGATVSFVPDGAAVVVGDDVVGYTITGTQAEIRATLDSFSVTPPLHSDNDFSLSVEVTTTDADGSTATTTDFHVIDLNAEADAPTVDVTSSVVDEDATANFGSSISYSLVDADGSEVVSLVELSNIPATATVNYLAVGTAVVTPVGAGGYTITGGQADIRATLDSFTIRPPADSDADIPVTVAVTTRDADNSTATSTNTHTVNVAAVADAPTIAGAGAGNEDTVIAVPVAVALTDNDGSETIDFVEITAPAGVTLDGFGPSGATVNQVGQVWTITGTDAQIQAAMNAMTVTPPQHSDVDFTLAVTVQSIESTLSGGQVTTPTAQTSFNVPVTVTAVADAPIVDPTSTNVDEDVDTVFGSDISYALVDADGSEVVSQVELGNIPATATISYTVVGTAVVTPVGATGYTITGAEADIRATLDSFSIQPPADSDADIAMSVDVTTTDTGGVTAVTSNTHTINVAAVADAPTIAGAGAGNEDTDISVPVAVALTDNDGSETIDFVEITAPAGVVLGGFGPSGATVNQVGQTWTIAGTDAQIQAAMNAMTATPPLHSDADFTLAVTVQSVESTLDGGQVTTPTAQTSFNVPVTVTAVADAPTVTTASTAVDEDTQTVFGTDIAYALVDADGSEVISQVEIGTIPVGATAAFTPSGAAVVTPVMTGLDITGYTITGTQAEIRATLDTFAITPPNDSDANFSLSIDVTTTDTGGVTAVTSDTHDIIVAAIADTPTGSGAGNGNEDTAIAAPISVSLNDTDGSETIQSVVVVAPPGVVLGGYGPSGATVGVVGTTYTFTGTDAQIQAALTALTATPPLHSDDDISLDVTVTAVESNPTEAEVGTLTSSFNFTTVTVVQAVADTPGAVGQNYNTDEDIAVNFAGLSGALVDNDGSETLTFQITGVDPDASFDVGTDLGGGIWSFSEAQINAGINYTPPPQEHGVFNMTLEAIATEAAVGGQVALKTAVGTAPISVTVAAVLDTPVLNNGATTVDEDVTIPLGTDIDLSLVDVDGSQTMSITLTGIPAANTVSVNGALPGSFSGPVGGVYTISGTAQEAMDILDSLTVTTPQHDDTNFSVAIAVTTTETSTGDNVTVNATHNVTVSAVADAPNLAAVGGSGDEDTVIAIPVTTSLVDTDGTERLDFVDISGVPADATLGWNIALPGSVVDQGGGVFRFSGTEAEIQNLLATLTIQRGAHIGDDVTLTATAQTTEFNPTEGGDVSVLTATSSVPIIIDVVPVADQPTVNVGAGVFNTEEDTPIALAGFGGALVDADGSETLTYQITNVPAGASFTSGTNLGGGVWSFTAAEISGGISFRPPLNLHGTFNMNLTSIATEGENNDAATNTLPFSIVVDAQADAPVITASAIGDEDTAINYGSQVAVSLFDSDGSESITSIVIDMSASAIVPVFATIGAANVAVAGDVYTITGPQADIQATLDTFTLTPPAQSDVDIPFTVSANTIDADASTNTATLNSTIIVRAVADNPTSASANANGTEDVWFNLNGLVAGPSVDLDGSETISAVLTNLPVGTDVRVVGVPGAIVTQQGNDWVITAPDLATLNNALATAEMRGPEHFSGIFTATLDVVATEAATGIQVSVPTATASSNFDITIGAVVDAPALEVTPATAGAAGFEDTAIPLSISIDNVDNDGSEVLTIQITGVPAGAALSAGVDAGGGVWNLTEADLVGLTITPPLHSNIDFQLTVNATSTENVPGLPGDGDMVTVSATLDVEVIGVADVPNFVANPVVSPEDSPIPLGAAVVGSLVDNDGSETLSYVISGLPAGVIPSAGTYIGGSWQVDAADMAGLTIPAPANFSGDYVADFAPALSIRAVSQEDDGDQAFIDVPLSITVSPVIDSATAGTGVIVNEDNNISLAGIAPTAFSDNDGSETVVDYVIDFNSIVADAQIGNIVADANDFIANHVIGTFVDNSNGTITVAAADLAGISLNAAAFLDSNIDFTIPVTTNIQDQAGATIVTGSVNSNFAIDLVGVADVPTVFANDVSGNDGVIMAINPTGVEFGGDTTDTDSSALGRADSEGIYYIVSGVQDNPTINMAFVDSTGAIIGLNNNDGTWLLTPADLADVNILTAGGSSGTVTLTLTTIATENDGDRATNAVNFDLTVTNSGGSGSVVAPLPPIVTINIVPGNEDSAITFAVTANPDPADPSPTPPSVSVIIRGVPVGAEVIGATYNSVNDTWVASAALVNSGGVSIIPPEDFSGPMPITVEAVATNENLLSASSGVLNSPVDVIPVADGPDIAITSPNGDEESAIPLNIAISLRDTNGTLNETINEPVVVTVDNGATLSAGTDIGGGSYELTLAQLAGLTVTPAANFSGTIGVSVTAGTTEPGNGDSVNTVGVGTVTVAAVADAPVAVAANSIGDEDTAISLVGLSANLADNDGSEVLSVKISGVPDDTILSAGTNNGDGSWTVSPADLATLSLTPPPNFSGTLSLTLEAFSLETSNGDTATATAAFDVNVNPVGDDVLIKFFRQKGDEGTDIDLKLRTQLGDNTGNSAGENPRETVEITFTNVPIGAAINAPGGGTITDLGGGSWFFEGTQAESRALTIFSTGIDGKYFIDISAVSNDNGVLGVPTVGTKKIIFTKVDDQTVNGTGGDDVLAGAAGDDTITGLAGADILTGGSGSDIIDGGSGNDTITGGPGSDTLTGGSGADTFIYGSSSTLAGAVDTITDFTTADNDALDLQSLLPGYNQGVDVLSDFVNLVEAGGNTTVQIDQSGTGTFTTDVVVLTGVTGLNVNTMEANNNLIV